MKVALFYLYDSGNLIIMCYKYQFLEFVINHLKYLHCLLNIFVYLKTNYKVVFIFSLQGSKHPLQPPHPGALTSLMMYNNEHLASPPPAHMGIPPVHIDPKTGKFLILVCVVDQIWCYAI